MRLATVFQPSFLKTAPSLILICEILNVLPSALYTSPTMNGCSPLQVRVTGIVFQPSCIEIRTTTSSISRVHRVLISDAIACSTLRGPDSIDATWTPETSSPHSATNLSPTETLSSGRNSVLQIREAPSFDTIVFTKIGSGIFIFGVCQTLPQRVQRTSRSWDSERISWSSSSPHAGQRCSIYIE